MTLAPLSFEKIENNASFEWAVFVHGAGGSTRTWRRQREDFGAQYNLLLIDLPDHGANAGKAAVSEEYTWDGLADTLWATVDAAGLKQVHLVGLSLGSILVMDMERMQPSRTLSMVLGGAIVKLTPQLRFIANTSLALAKLIGFRSFYKLAARIALPRKNHKKSRDVFVRESQALSIPAFKRWTELYTGLDDHLNMLFMRTTTTPRLLVMGGQDHLFGKQAALYAKRHRHTELDVAPECGHVVSIEQPQFFNATALAFLKRITRSILQVEAA